jgi:hypothetical protein
MNSTICSAIKNKQELELTYHGYRREVQPHALGINDHGDEVLRCYQTKGRSESSNQSGWKLLLIKEISFLYNLNVGFLTHPQYKRNDKSMKQVICEI